MPDVTRQQLLESLDQGWGMYAARFHQLSTSEQATFLQQQGYARLADLLAHVTAWWSEGIPAVERMLTDAAYRSPDVDVDAFNARAVAAAAERSEADVLAAFDSTRRAFRALVQRLPETAFKDKRIQWRLHIEIIGHLEEHDLPA
jgi:hypothetical protein